MVLKNWRIWQLPLSLKSLLGLAPLFPFATEPAMPLTSWRLRFRPRMRDIAAPVDVQMIVVAQLNIPLPSFALGAAWPFFPPSILDVNVFARGFPGERLVTSPLLGRNKREFAANWQVVLM